MKEATLLKARTSFFLFLTKIHSIFTSANSSYSMSDSKKSN